jgi:stage II sporulation protein AA (anti-sigma F factor antagonist)
MNILKIYGNNISLRNLLLYYLQGRVHMGVRVSSCGSTLKALIEGDIDHHTAKEIRETIDGYVEQYNPKLLELDFGGVQFMDSSGIGLIMGRFKLMSSIKGSLKVINIPKSLERMVKLSGLAALGIFEKEEKKANARRNKRNEYKFF